MLRLAGLYSGWTHSCHCNCIVAAAKALMKDPCLFLGLDELTLALICIQGDFRLLEDLLSFAYQVIHPSMANVAKNDLAEKLGKMYKVRG